MLTAVILFIVILSLLVFVHEWGHYTVARRNGMKVDEFGFGFPPRLGGIIQDEETGKWEFVRGNKDIESKNTIFSINWIPLGGFVRIKGEDGSGRNDPESFASKSAWARIKVLCAGVAMNVVAAWVLFSIIMGMGTWQQVDPDQAATSTEKINVLVTRVVQDSPAQEMGMQMGDVLVGAIFADAMSVPVVDEVLQRGISVSHSSDVQKFISTSGQRELVLVVVRGDKEILLIGTPDMREGVAVIGIEMADAIKTSVPWYKAPIEGLFATGRVTAGIFNEFGKFFAGFFSTEKQETQIDVAGPVGIAYITKQMSELGLASILQFAALLSLNLAIINILPFPALDGGRVVFVLLEVIRRGKPVDRNMENIVHGIGFALLLALMVVVTFIDLDKFNIGEKIMSIF